MEVSGMLTWLSNVWNLTHCLRPAQYMIDSVDHVTEAQSPPWLVSGITRVLVKAKVLYECLNRTYRAINFNM